MNRIKELLETKGETHVWLALATGERPEDVLRYLNNQKQPEIPVFIKIAEALKVDALDLLA
jgi:hypothetical protein